MKNVPARLQNVAIRQQISFPIIVLVSPFFVHIQMYHLPPKQYLSRLREVTGLHVYTTKFHKFKKK